MIHEYLRNRITVRTEEEEREERERGQRSNQKR